MLEDIVNSKKESEILSFFLAAPWRSYSIYEVAKRLRVPYLSAAHTLAKLATLGPLSQFSKRGKKYYLLNQKYPLLPGLSNYWQAEGVKYQDELFSAIKQIGQVKAAFLSGIFTANPQLPVDILIVGKVNLDKLSHFIKSVNKIMQQEINYSIMSVDEFVLRRNTFDKFIKDIFDYRHIVVMDELVK